MIIDWTAFIKTLIIIALSIIIGTIMIVSSLQFQNQMKDWEKAQQDKRNKLEGQYWRLKEDLEIVNNNYLTHYYQFQKEGFFSENPKITLNEQRFNMEREIESYLLSPLKTHKKLFASKHELLEAKQYIINSIETIDSFKTYQIRIHFELELFHEEHFRIFLDKINKWDLSSLFNLQSCDLKRLRELKNTKDVSKPYFQANCVLVWYTSRLEND